MKKRLLLGTLILGAFYIIGSSYSSMPGASGIDGTGATGPTGCSCHGGIVTGITIALELDSAGIPVTSYLGGHSYTIKITATNTTTSSLPNFGFQVGAVLSAGAGSGSATNAGTLATSGLPPSCSNDAVTGSYNVIEHTTAIPATSGTGGSGTTYSETVAWTAPVAGTGTIKLYGMVNAVNHDGNTTGDKWNRNNVTITEETAAPTVDPITGTATVCVGSTTTLADASTGGSWSSGSTGIATVSSSGVVTGVTGGTAIISYNDGASGIATLTVTVNTVPATPPAITSATSTVCVGGTLSCTDGTSGGTWTSGATGTATVSSSGDVTGVAAGTVNITYTVSNTCGSAYTVKALTVMGAPAAPAAISGLTFICTGSTATMTDATTGGVWSTTSTSVATVTSGGIVTGASSGIDTVKYTVSNTCGSSSAALAVTVNSAPATPAPITGTLSVCAGNATHLTETVGGGTWSSVSTSIAVVSPTGIVTGLSGGTDTIKYVISSTCGTSSVYAVVTVNPLPVPPAPIAGTLIVCTGSTTSLSETTTGGTWISTTPSVATISTGGVVTASSIGIDTIKYAVTNSCGSSFATALVTVNSVPSVPPAITGTSVVCSGATISLNDSVTGGTWSSSSSGTAAVGSSSGVVTGVTPGTANITYTVTNSCGSNFIIRPVTVNTVPPAPAAIGGTLSLCPSATVTATDATSGGVWSISGSGVASVSPLGVISGLSSGMALLSYGVSNSCGSSYAMSVVTVNPMPYAAPITGGSSSICYLSGTTFTDSISGGVWSVASTAFVTINPSTGVVSGVGPGLETISYSVHNSCGTAVVTTTMNVTTTPYAGTLTGPSNLCTGIPTPYPDPVTGGVWTIANGNASIAGDIVTAINPGMDTVIYTTTTPCGIASTTAVITINMSPEPGTITGAADLCAGTSLVLHDTATGGIWSDGGSTLIALDSMGNVIGLAGGTVTVSYSETTVCGTASATVTFTVVPIPDAGVLAGPHELCLGLPTTYVASGAGGIWYSSNTTNVTIDSTTGVANGLVVGGSTILTYTITNMCGTSTDTMHVHVTTLPASSGIISGPDTVCIGNAISMTESVGGGIWSTSNPNLAMYSVGSFTGINLGMDTIIYTKTNACGSVHSTQVVTIFPASHCWPLGLTGTSEEPVAIQIYPNPSSGIVTIEFPAGMQQATVTIFNQIGAVVASYPFDSKGGNSITANLNAQPAGTYAIRITTTNSIFTGKIIKW